MDLRKQFIEELEKYAKTNDKVIFITADVGFSFLDPLKKILGDRFFNLGITESSAMLTAGGLAKEGYKVFIYSMIPFVLFRPFEMVRTVIGCGNLDVTLLGVSGSEAYSMLGYSHNMISADEDAKHARLIPNFSVYTPTTEDMMRKTAIRTFKETNPKFIRL